jgi:hypothetical protein
VSAGWLSRWSTDKAVATVTDTHDELLFAGTMPVERINEASESGVVIGFVPSAVKADGTLALDLASTPIYWAKPEILPEALTAGRRPGDLRSGRVGRRRGPAGPTSSSAPKRRTTARSTMQTEGLL